MYDVLAAKIEHVHRAYGLNGKVTATVTDNGSNFVKPLSLSLIFHPQLLILSQCFFFPPRHTS